MRNDYYKVKKKGMKTWEMRHETRFSYMKMQNSKFGGNIYFEFEDKFGILPGVHFRDIIYLFKAQEVRSPTV